MRGQHNETITVEMTTAEANLLRFLLQNTKPIEPQDEGTFGAARIQNASRVAEELSYILSINLHDIALTQLNALKYREQQRKQREQKRRAKEQKK